MPAILRVNQEVGDYRIEKELNRGAFAVAFKAVSKKAGGPVFFKQYKSPSVAVDWYKGFVKYQKELKARVEAGSVKNYVYRFIDFFESKASGQNCFYQVFEFISEGRSLDNYLSDASSEGEADWGRRLTFAKLFMAGMRKLHEARIVHCDLKPKNIYLIKDDTIAAKYRLKIVDLDFSILADRQAPWHNKQGYTGTPRYLSPEHLRGAVPEPASDVFTCGLILSELLTSEGHPYALDDEEYKDAIFSHRARIPTLRKPGHFPSDDLVCKILHDCLNPDPAKRPSAEMVHQALLGEASSSTAVAPKPEAAPSSLPPSAATLPAEASPSASARISTPPPTPKILKLVLSNETGELVFGITTPVGSALCKNLGRDAGYMSNPQFTLFRKGDAWVASPNPDATNETLLNGKIVAGETSLREGDVLAVGRESKGVVKLPLKVGFREE